MTNDQPGGIEHRIRFQDARFHDFVLFKRRKFRESRKSQAVTIVKTQKRMNGKKKNEELRQVMIETGKKERKRIGELRPFFIQTERQKGKNE